MGYCSKLMGLHMLKNNGEINKGVCYENKHLYNV